MRDESSLRLDAIRFVRGLRERWVAVPAADLRRFEIHLKGQQGIFKPAELSAPISLTTTLQSGHTQDVFRRELRAVRLRVARLWKIIATGVVESVQPHAWRISSTIGKRQSLDYNAIYLRRTTLAQSPRRRVVEHHEGTRVIGLVIRVVESAANVIPVTLRHVSLDVALLVKLTAVHHGEPSAYPLSAPSVTRRRSGLVERRTISSAASGSARPEAELNITSVHRPLRFYINT